MFFKVLIEILVPLCFGKKSSIIQETDGTYSIYNILFFLLIFWLSIHKINLINN